ncbi:hypothetical protein RI844_19250 [Thalassotalea fonticola]|uniref:Uncharacterized protein n=1 Tax=Thalassotalea fonticola TaxID=3065649 RepID=A0ABZ0GNQ8_9GAMM|nr:hypothetical protein RI844_19250 [Colwelliaceae bacterium S1-1]
MKPLNLLPLLLLSLAYIANVNATGNSKLDAIDWSQSYSEVKQSHTTKPDDEIPTRITYESHLFDIEFHKEYLFNNDGKLVNVLYYKGFSAEATNCVSAYEEVKAEVEKQYGVAKIVTNNKVDLATVNVEQLCQSTSKGDYKLNSEWKNDNANISFVLDSWKGQAYMGLSYKPLETH